MDAIVLLEIVRTPCHELLVNVENHCNMRIFPMDPSSGDPNFAVGLQLGKLKK
jgi:hypothetical protein